MVSNLEARIRFAAGGVPWTTDRVSVEGRHVIACTLHELLVALRRDDIASSLPRGTPMIHVLIASYPTPHGLVHIGSCDPASQGFLHQASRPVSWIPGRGRGNGPEADGQYRKPRSPRHPAPLAGHRSGSPAWATQSLVSSTS